MRTLTNGLKFLVTIVALALLALLTTTSGVAFGTDNAGSNNQGTVFNRVTFAAVRQRFRAMSELVSSLLTLVDDADDGGGGFFNSS